MAFGVYTIEDTSQTIIAEYIHAGQWYQDKDKLVYVVAEDTNDNDALFLILYLPNQVVETITTMHEVRGAKQIADVLNERKAQEVEVDINVQNFA